MLELDERFGRLEVPKRLSEHTPVYPWEENNKPASWTQLNQSSSKQLRSFMGDVRSGFQTGKILVDDVLIIWVVDEHGEIRFAVEEMVIGDKPTGRPKLQTFPLTRYTKKLGHPSLVTDTPNQHARISGEIALLATRNRAYWQINRKSGRYSYHNDRTFVHLKNAADRFRSFGIELVITSDF